MGTRWAKVPASGAFRDRGESLEIASKLCLLTCHLLSLHMTIFLCVSLVISLGTWSWPDSKEPRGIESTLVKYGPQL